MLDGGVYPPRGPGDAQQSICVNADAGEPGSPPSAPAVNDETMRKRGNKR